MIIDRLIASSPMNGSKKSMLWRLRSRDLVVPCLRFLLPFLWFSGSPRFVELNSSTQTSLEVMWNFLIVSSIDIRHVHLQDGGERYGRYDQSLVTMTVNWHLWPLLNKNRYFDEVYVTTDDVQLCDEAVNISIRQWNEGWHKHIKWMRQCWRRGQILSKISRQVLW